METKDIYVQQKVGLRSGDVITGDRVSLHELIEENGGLNIISLENVIKAFERQLESVRDFKNMTFFMVNVNGVSRFIHPDNISYVEIHGMDKLLEKVIELIENGDY